ncbi:MAG TPA: hypothetical protein VN660_09430 [Steroidobacteraceae bacterium]|nr:hypothetical protein [Steroidobacteraceae bacterium]
MTELHRALSDIRSIRGQLARGMEFRGYGPPALASTGIAAWLAAIVQWSWLGALTHDIHAYLEVWVPTAVICFSIIVIEAHVRATRLHGGLAPQMMRAALEQFLPPLSVGLLLTVILCTRLPGVCWMLPGLWQLIFSLGVFASCRLLPAPVFAVGVWYMACGLACLALGSEALSPWAMAVPFGIGQLLVALALHHGYRQHELG